MSASLPKRGACRMLWLLILAAELPTAGTAQFSSLSTSRDGSVLYFSTTFREKNTAQPTYGKIFAIDSSGLHLLYSRPITNQTDPCSNAYDLTRVSASGGVLDVLGECSCLNGNPTDVYNCGKSNRYTSTVVTGDQSHDYPGEFWLSRNGKLALQRIGTNLPFGPYACYVIDLSSGQTIGSYGNIGTPTYSPPYSPFILLGTTAAATGRVLADNGTAVLSSDSSAGVPGILILYRGVVQHIPLPSNEIVFADATIDAAGSTVLFTAHNTVTNRNSILSASPGVSKTGTFMLNAWFPSISDDGLQVLYLSDRSGSPQAWLIGIDGTGGRQLTDESDSIAEAILSGDGSVAYALTLGGRLLKISVSGAQVQELIPRTPYLDIMVPSPTSNSLPVSQGFAPGKRTILTGGGLSSGSFSASAPFPSTLGGVSASLSGRPMPLLDVDPDRIDLLVPPDLPLPDPSLQTSSSLHLQTNSSSPFETPSDVTTTIVPAAPETVGTFHGDWRPVSTDRPARPGELLHTYAVGLGPTTPPVAFEAAAPSTEPLARLTPPLECMEYFEAPPYGQIPIDVLFAGLAPGMVAIYQVDWRVPSTPNHLGYVYMVCRTIGWSVQVPLAPASPPPRGR